MIEERCLLGVELPPKRTGRAPAPDLVERRAAIAQLSGPDPGAYVKVGNLTCAEASHQRPRALIVHCHGGGYRHGSAAGWAAFGARLATVTRTRVLVPDYSLAPESPCPAAIHELVGVLAEALGQAERLPVILAGDSAGGGLALAIANALKRPMPLAGLVLFSPWLDLRLQAEGYERCAATDLVFSKMSAAASADEYLQGMPADHPLASPLLGALEGLPPILVQAAAGEVLLDDSLALVHRAAAAGVRAQLHIEPDVQHVWPVMSPDSPASARALERVSRFLDEIEAG